MVDPVIEVFEVFDWERLVFGDHPAFFILEIALRSLIMYFYVVMVLRFMGKRSLGQLTPVDYAIIIALGSATGDAMFYSDVPLTHGMTVLTAIVIIDRALAFITEHHDRAEAFFEGRPTRMITQGTIDMDAMERENLPRDELFMYLREEGVEQLGQVREAYLEVSGNMSIFRTDPGKVQPGLPIVPPWSMIPPKIYSPGSPIPHPGDYACAACGALAYLDGVDIFPTCTACPGSGWVEASRAGMEGG